MKRTAETHPNEVVQMGYSFPYRFYAFQEALEAFVEYLTTELDYDVKRAYTRDEDYLIMLMTDTRQNHEKHKKRYYEIMGLTDDEIMAFYWYRYQCVEHPWSSPPIPGEEKKPIDKSLFTKELREDHPVKLMELLRDPNVKITVVDELEDED